MQEPGHYLQSAPADYNRFHLLAKDRTIIETVSIPPSNLLPDAILFNTILYLKRKRANTIDPVACENPGNYEYIEAVVVVPEFFGANQ